MKVELFAESNQALAQVGIAATVAHIPLAGRHNLERLVALLKELHRVSYRLRLANHVARFLQQLNDSLLCREHGLAGKFGIDLLAACACDDLWCVCQNAPIPADDCAVWQVELAPPDHVGDVTECANHGDARTLVDLSQSVRDNRNLDTEQRGLHGLAEHVLVAVVIWVRNQRDTGGQHLWAGGFDEKLAAIPE